MKDHIKIADWLAELLDNRFSIAGYRFGLDPIIGFVPVLGDIIPAVLSLYIIWIGWQNKLPREVLGRMLLNLLLEVGVGFFPVIGDAADFAIKSNTRNMNLLKQHLKSPVLDGEVVKPL